MNKNTVPVVTSLLPIMAMVFIAYLVIGGAMPVLPLHVHGGLGLSAFVVGLVSGSQFAASLLSRMWAGYYTDSKGAKRAVVKGWSQDYEHQHRRNRSEVNHYACNCHVWSRRRSHRERP